MRSRATPSPTAFALVGVGGFVGATLRHGVTVALPAAPLGTLTVNVVGSVLLALVLSQDRAAQRLSGRARLFLATGVLSSVTTYSTFAVEATTLAGGATGAFPTWALAYVTGNYALALLAVLGAHSLARWRP